jgi:hypothetical protein
MRAKRWAAAGLALAISAAVQTAAPAEASAARIALGGAPARGGLHGVILARGLGGRHGAPVHATTVAKLTYHHGPVMRTNTTFAIYWAPAGASMAPGYTGAIDRYFTDVAADSGLNTNVYSTERQYRDTTGKIAYASTFAGSTVDSAPFPSNGCAPYVGVTGCLTDAQIAAEVTRVVAALHLPVDGTHAYFMFLPQGMGTCLGKHCAFTYFCAYHSWSGKLLYANIPYVTFDGSACGVAQRPVGSDADGTLNVASHEHREMINDPYGTGWYDSSHYEGSDKCAWTFGSPLGTTTGGEFNQAIAGHDYYLQQEWSNSTVHCVQRGT